MPKSLAEPFGDRIFVSSVTPVTFAGRHL